MDGSKAQPIKKSAQEHEVYFEDQEGMVLQRGGDLDDAIWVQDYGR